MTTGEKPTTVSRMAMATRFEIALFGAEPVRLTAAGEGALDEIVRLEERLSFYLSTSEVSGMNATAWQRPFRMDPRLYRLMKIAKSVWEETQGAFDVTIGPLMRAWGLAGGSGEVPSEEELHKVMTGVGMEHLHLDDESFSVKYDTEGVKVDLGAIAKGYAVEQTAEHLVECGVTDALVHGGTSSIQAIGTPPEQPGWRVRVKAPGGLQKGLVDVVLKDQSLSVSAVLGKAFEADGKVLGHVIDPRVGYPTQAALAAAVVGPSATEGDAFSTALLVLGEDGLGLVAEKRPDLQCLVAIPEEEGIRVHTTGDIWQQIAGASG